MLTFNFLFEEVTQNNAEVKTIQVRTVEDIPKEYRPILVQYVHKLEDVENRQDPDVARLLKNKWENKTPQYIFQNWIDRLMDLNLLLVNGHLAGMALTNSDHRMFYQTGFIQTFYIDDPYRGQGYGRYFLKELMKRLHSQGCKNIALNVFAENHIARTLYSKMGFRPTNLTMIKFGK